MKYNMCIFLIIISVCHSFSQNRTPLDLNGHWRTTNLKTNAGEQWTLNDSSKLSGFGYKIKGDSIQFTESLMLIKMNNYWLYIAQVGKQQPISFTLDSTGSNTLLFVNKEHDFPQYIHYAFKDDHHLVVSVGSYTSKSVMIYNFERTQLLPIQK